MSIDRRDPSIVKLDGVQMPGRAKSIADAEKKWKWTDQKPTASGGATSVFGGEELNGGITIIFETTTEEGRQAHYDYRATIAPTKGAKPRTFTVDNVVIEYNKIKRVVLDTLKQPQITQTLSWIFTYMLREYNPPAPAKVGPADAAGKGFKNAKMGGDKDIATLQAKAAALQKQLAKA